MLSLVTFFRDRKCFVAVPRSSGGTCTLIPASSADMAPATNKAGREGLEAVKCGVDYVYCGLVPKSSAEALVQAPAQGLAKRIRVVTFNLSPKPKLK